MDLRTEHYSRFQPNMHRGIGNEIYTEVCVLLAVEGDALQFLGLVSVCSRALSELSQVRTIDAQTLRSTSKYLDDVANKGS